jgi:GrpB-like predicted nucleotidyltransferase (UPF0157 family)
VLEVDEPIEIVAADPRWADAYEVEATRMRAVLLGRGVALEHIGSTAVPGLAAKPIVDVMVGVPTLEQSDAVVERIVPLGYTELEGAPGRRYLRCRGERSFNVQVVERDGELWRSNLRFRELLRADDSAARRYEAAKLVAAEADPSLLAYSEAKAPAIRELLAGG